ncbi:MAG TPA: winged helix-turn-helix transcriptional regulator [Nitrososphaeraceae archaeon]|jgi:predicted transcriptional regulator
MNLESGHSAGVPHILGHGTQTIQDFRNDIDESLLACIDRNPGVRYRELLRIFHLGNGVLSYHLAILERIGKIRVDRKRNKITRYYLTGVPDGDTDLIGQMRNKMTRQLILFMLEHDRCTFGEIVENSGKAPSTISWHLNRLREAGIISMSLGERTQHYAIVDSREVKKILVMYKDAFLDKIVDNYVGIMDQL